MHSVIGSLFLGFTIPAQPGNLAISQDRGGGMLELSIVEELFAGDDRGENLLSRVIAMRLWIVVALVLFSGCKPSVSDLRAQYAKEKEKLGEREKALLEFDRFKVDLAGQERIQKADVDKVEQSLAESGADRQGRKYEDDQKYVATQRESLAEADHIVDETRAKLVAEVEDQRRKVAEVEAQLKKAQR